MKSPLYPPNFRIYLLTQIKLLLGEFQATILNEIYKFSCMEDFSVLTQPSNLHAKKPFLSSFYSF